ncbi:MAG: glycoside hydrolase family 13 protein [Clostridia bacterium]|nr:glycoside hydrolase family 13 protein [Clostridia bacterium]
MNYFKGEKIQVSVSNNTTRISERYVITLQIAEEYGYLENVRVIINQQKQSNEREICMNYVETKNGICSFSCNVDFKSVGIYYFCIKILINNKEKTIKNDVKNKCASITDKDCPYWTVTVYDDDFKVPDWAKGKIMYQIFPDRFFKSENYVPIPIAERCTKQWGEIPNWDIDKEGKIHNNDYFMGNLKGIEEKLDYLKDLNVQIIYLNPIFLSQSNHRYDTADYEVVDPYLGTNDDMKRLCSKAHEYGIKILIDGVLNHTGNDSKYFNEFKKYETVGAFQGNQSPYYNWYKKNEKGGFEYWWGFKNLPVCDSNNEKWQEYVYGENGIIDKWFSLGIDGLRLDVVDELSDKFIENVRKAVKRNKQDGLIIGEVWENAVTKEGYGEQRKYLLGKELDSVMNYPFTNAILKYVRFGDFEILVDTINDILTFYPEEVLPALMNSLSTHDITRALTSLGADGIQNYKNGWIWDIPYSRDWQFTKDCMDSEQYEKAKELLKIATAIQYFLPGCPCIYYGDEAGLYGYKDPFNRKCFPWDNIDNELNEFFKELGNARKQSDFIAEAKLNIVEINENIFAFERYLNNSLRGKNKRVLVMINRSTEKQEINMPIIYKNATVLFEKNCKKDDILGYGIMIKILD